MGRMIVVCLLSGLIGVLAMGYIFVSRPYLANQQHDRFFEKPGAGSYQKTRRVFLARLAAQAGPGRIWFIGHSHIEGLDASQIDPRALSLGIGGERLGFTRARLADYDTLSTATAIVFAIGANDLPDTQTGEMQAQAKTVLAAVPAHIPVVWSLVLPVDAKMSKWMPAAKIAATNAAWQNLCDQRPRCIVSDATRQLADPAGHLRAAYHGGDGEHLNAAGYAIWRSVLKSDLATVLAAQE
jgi:lysophospholipase L1-like esterase